MFKEDGVLAKRIGRINRLLFILLLPVIILGTSVPSYLMLSVHVEKQTIVLEPKSHHSFRFGIYGLGTVTHSESRVDEAWESNVCVIEMGRDDYERFVSGEPYGYFGYRTVGIGGEGYSLTTGPLWELYVVLVNDGYSVAEVSFEAEGRAYFSAPVAVPLVGAYATVWYAVNRPLTKHRLRGMEPRLIVNARAIRVRANLIISALIGLALLIYFAVKSFGETVPNDRPGAFLFRYLGIYLGFLVPSIIAFLIRPSIMRVRGERPKVVADLATKLRIGGFAVSRKDDAITVLNTKFFATKIACRDSTDGVVVKYQAYATPLGWLTWFVLLFLCTYTAPILLLFSIIAFHRSTAFASEHILRKLAEPPVSAITRRDEKTRVLLLETLSESRRLSREALESAKSVYHDHVLLLVVLALGVWLGVTILGAWYLFEDYTPGPGLLYSLGTGAAIGLAFSLTGWRMLARKVRKRIKELAMWTDLLERAFEREVSAERSLDGTMSSFELIAESYKRLPDWLETRRRGAWAREPVTWALIFFLLYSALSLLPAAILETVEGHPFGIILLLVFAALCALIVRLYRRWTIIQKTEADVLAKDWDAKFETLKSEMESLFGSV